MLLCCGVLFIVVLYTSMLTHLWTPFWSIMIRRLFYSLIKGCFVATDPRVHLVMQNNSNSLQVQMADLESPLHFLQNIHQYYSEVVDPAWGKHTKARCQCQQSVSQAAEEKPVANVVPCSFPRFSLPQAICWVSANKSAHVTDILPYLHCWSVGWSGAVDEMSLSKGIFSSSDPSVWTGWCKIHWQRKASLDSVCLETLKWG